MLISPMLVHFLLHGSYGLPLALCLPWPLAEHTTFRHILLIFVISVRFFFRVAMQFKVFDSYLEKVWMKCSQIWQGNISRPQRNRFPCSVGLVTFSAIVTWLIDTYLLFTPVILKMHGSNEHKLCWHDDLSRSISDWLIMLCWFSGLWNSVGKCNGMNFTLSW